MSGFQSSHVRTRLTVWYVTVLAGVLLVYVGGASALIFFQLRSELDRFAIDDLETVEGLLNFGSDGKLSLRSDYHDHPYTASMQDRLLEVWAGDGTLLYRNELLGNRDLGRAPDASEGADGYSIRSTRVSDGTPARLVSKIHILEGRPTLIRVAFSESPLWAAFLAGCDGHDCRLAVRAGTRRSGRLFSGKACPQSNRAHGASRS